MNAKTKKEENHNSRFETVDTLRDNCIYKQKRGIHFILSSLILWGLITIAFATDLPIVWKNMMVFVCSMLLMPLAVMFSKLLKIDFSNKSNPLTNLGIIFSVNQVLYILIAMWAFVFAPQYMLMIYAIIFGAHLMPYGWLYKSKSYFAASVAIPLVVLISAIYFSPMYVGACVWLVVAVFCLGLWRENRNVKS